jgi:hypothetical protein
MERNMNGEERVEDEDGEERKRRKRRSKYVKE